VLLQWHLTDESRQSLQYVVCRVVVIPRLEKGFPVGACGPYIPYPLLHSGRFGFWCIAQHFRINISVRRSSVSQAFLLFKGALSQGTKGLKRKAHADDNNRNSLLWKC